MGKCRKRGREEGKIIKSRFSSPSQTSRLLLPCFVAETVSLDAPWIVRKGGRKKSQNSPRFD